MVVYTSPYIKQIRLVSCRWNYSLKVDVTNVPSNTKKRTCLHFGIRKLRNSTLLVMILENSTGEIGRFKPYTIAVAHRARSLVALVLINCVRRITRTTFHDRLRHYVGQLLICITQIDRLLHFYRASEKPSHSNLFVRVCLSGGAQSILRKYHDYFDGPCICGAQTTHCV